MTCVAADRHRRPLADRGSPGRTHGNAVTNPRIRVCSTVVLTALPPAPRTRSNLPQPVPANGIAHPRPTSLTTNIRVSAGQLVVAPRVRLLPRYRRSLLRRVEQAHRPALAHHVHRPPRLGQCIQCMTLSAGWYYVRVDVEPEITWVPRTRLASVRLTGGSSLARTGQARPGYLRPKIKARTGRRRMHRTTPRMTIDNTRSVNKSPIASFHA